MSALLVARGLEKSFPLAAGGWAVGRRPLVHALSGVDLELERGECLGLVGESGSGKTTLGRCLLRLTEPTAGTLHFAGEDLLALSRPELRRRRRHFQMVFQDPDGSLNPRLTVGRALAEPLAVHRLTPRRERPRRVAELLALVGLPADAARRYPHQLSGGQRQRVGIARALAAEPELLVADEPVSGLDVSVRAQVLNLIDGLRARLGLSLLLIAHDLAVVEQVADRVAVMYLGRVVESAPRNELFAHPQHPYTALLLAAVPQPDPARRGRRPPLGGEPASALAPPPGCPFHPRCPVARERCRRQRPELAEVRPGHRAACFFPGEVTAAAAALPPPGGGREDPGNGNIPSLPT